MRETADASNAPVLHQKRVQGVCQAYAGHHLHDKVSCKQPGNRHQIIDASSELTEKQRLCILDRRMLSWVSAAAETFLCFC